ncbi:GPW/gp25 family protein [Flavobacterium sp.]|uniref:GPW/gp25 family protein n=1 Tax=Flavobacterium sp. TaxID=239 RepID=UPI00261903EC|nr:GPW/gp25 family protein [Flavobacterium sp.]
MKEETFLGTGWSFPPSFNADSGTVITVSDAMDIVQSLQILITTKLNERVMRPDYGCDLTPLLFENITVTLLTGIKDIIKTAILKYEPRIDVADIVFTSDESTEGLLNILIDYVIRKTNSRQNHVFPFYLNEGTYIK